MPATKRSWSRAVYLGSQAIATYNLNMNKKEFFLARKQAIRERTRQVLEMVRPEHLTWKPEKEALSVGEMLRHIWVSEEGMRRIALEGDFAYYETRIPQGLRAVLGIPESLDHELQNLERVHTETLAKVRDYPLERFEEERIHEGFDFRRKVEAILFGLNDHEIHHRAQLMTYLRILGTPMPEFITRR